MGPSGGVEIRPATRADRSALVAFHSMLYADHQAEVMTQGDLELVAYRDLASTLREDVDSMLDDPRVVVLVASDASGAIGYATGHVEKDPRRVLGVRGVLGDWYVLEGSRGRGVGARLLAALFERFRAAGCVVVESQTWPGNAVGRAAHEALGFREIRVVYRRKL